jgi:Co/Zn/Cd efflux system component
MINNYDSLRVDSNRYRKNRLLVAMAICFALFALEFAGGIFVGSLAILADSYHMLTGYIHV